MCCDSYVFTLIVFNSPEDADLLLRRGCCDSGKLGMSSVVGSLCGPICSLWKLTALLSLWKLLMCEVEAEEEKKEGKKKTRKRKMKMNWCMERVIWRMKTITDDENDYEDDADDEEDDGQDVTPLLNPDENIAQWKAVKAKPVRRVKQLMKENVEPDSDDQAKPLMKEIIVNTSLVDWLASPKTFHGNGLCKRSQLVISPTWKTGQKFHSDSPL
ncbi:unnamed protein product [Brassica oleracea var. botrytis]